MALGGDGIGADRGGRATSRGVHAAETSLAIDHIRGRPLTALCCRSLFASLRMRRSARGPGRQGALLRSCPLPRALARHKQSTGLLVSGLSPPSSGLSARSLLLILRCAGPPAVL